MAGICLVSLLPFWLIWKISSLAYPVLKRKPLFFLILFFKFFTNIFWEGGKDLFPSTSKYRAPLIATSEFNFSKCWLILSVCQVSCQLPLQILMSLGRQHVVMSGTGRGKGSDKGILKQGVPLIGQAKYLKQKSNVSSLYF